LTDTNKKIFFDILKFLIIGIIIILFLLSLFFVIYVYNSYLVVLSNVIINFE